MELLSPAGNFESLKMAVKCGADAVYLGGKNFSARRNASNFTDEEIRSAVDFCHLHGVKVYVTLNIVIKENELNDAIKYAEYLISIGTDGIIIQDLGLLCAVRKMSSKIKINASTQMTICSSTGANFLKKLGVNRVVLARELSKAEIEQIKKNTDLELEVFVHGALCMSWSGQCYLSSIIGGRSGNRGLCAQPCRLNYTLLKDGKALTETKPLLCMKDLCLAEEMETLQKVADSFKIEGRMKSPEYTGVVTKVYKKAIKGTVSKDEIQKMLMFFSRGGSAKGYFYGRKFEKIMDYDISEKVTATRDCITEIKQTDEEKRRKISFCLVAKEGRPILLKAYSDNFFAEEEGIIAEQAKSRNFNEERIKSQLGKLGDTPFSLGEIEIDLYGNPFVSISTINGLRRSVCNKIEEKICQSYRCSIKRFKPAQPEHVVKKTPGLVVQVRTEEQMRAAESLGISAKYLSYELFLKRNLKGDICVLPSLTKEGEKLMLNEAETIVAQNIGQIDTDGKTVFGGERLNVTNSETVRILGDMGLKKITLSPELNLKEIKQITEKTNVDTEIIVYGRLPVMLMENCIIKSAYKCTKGEGKFTLCDRKGEQFPIICEGCRNVMLNSVPLYMADKAEDLLSLNVSSLRLVFTTENYDETRHVIAAYQSGLAGKEPHKVFDKITRGHFYRGVE